MAELKGIDGAVTAVTGFEKGSGKTTFLNYALPYARESGPVAVFTIGVDGSLKARNPGVAVPEIRVEPGDVVLTTETFARASGARFEVLDVLPGRMALGRLMLGRAVRGGAITLVGPEHFSLLAELIGKVRREGWARTVLVDGAVNRITQVSALGDVKFVFAVRTDRSNLARTAAKVRAVVELASLPREDPGGDGFRLDGPVTSEGLKLLPPDIERVSVEDFTKFFLEPAELLRALERYRFSVRRAFELLCLSVTLRDVSREEFLQAVGPGAGPKILFNPYEVLR
ncbi:MAG TPA: hypothetical protein PKM35_05050 [Holophaga sp.]|mgnify:FL=1|nr:hypothetical protein [Holophaga sp.]HPS67652.1 hypothetical protein [Holophaga sp.]